MIQRHPNWQGHLVEYLGRIAGTPYDPGTNDCALFAAGAVAAMTGVDLAGPFRGAYASLEAGFDLLKAAGHADHIDLVAKSFDEIHPALAAPGDLAVLEGLGGQALGVVQGEGIYVLTTSRLGMAPLGMAIRAFRVPS